MYLLDLEGPQSKSGGWNQRMSAAVSAHLWEERRKGGRPVCLGLRVPGVCGLAELGPLLPPWQARGQPSPLLAQLSTALLYFLNSSGSLITL